MGVILRKFFDKVSSKVLTSNLININVISRYLVMRLQTNIVNDNVLSIYIYIYNTFQRKYRDILINADCHVTIINMQSFKVGGVIMCEIMPYF